MRIPTRFSRARAPTELEMRAAGMSYQEIAAAGGGIRSTVANASGEREMN